MVANPTMLYKFAMNKAVTQYTDMSVGENTTSNISQSAAGNK